MVQGTVPRRRYPVRCKCGYGFTEKASKGLREFESYAVIRDAEYQEFLKSEVEALRADNGETSLGAIAQSSTYVGTGMVCPDCSRLTLLLPGGGATVSYQLEDIDAT